MRYGGALALLLCLVVPTRADMRLFTQLTLPAEVNEIVNNEISAAFPGAIINEEWLTDQFSDAGINDLPPTNWTRLRTLDAGVEVEDKNELGLMFTFTSPKPFDQKFTHGSKKMDDMLQYLLRGARGDVGIRLMERTVLAQRTLPGYMRAALWVKITIPKGAYNPVRRDIVYRPELADSMAAIRLALARHDAQLNDHERRIKALEDRPIAIGLDRNSIGLSGFAGAQTFTVAEQTYNGAVIGFNYRYMDFALEGFAGELFNDSRIMEQIGNDLVPTYKNNHVEGGSLYWAPLQDGRWGKYWKLGGTGLHAQRNNIENFSNEELYYAGLAGTLAWPWPIATPELWGTVGYGWTRTASPEYDVAPTKDEGLGFGIRLTLVIGRR
jgi:hypothetical protein